MRKVSVGFFLLLLVLIGIIPLFAQVDETLHIRIAHWSPDAPAVDVYVDGEVAIESLEYPIVTDWMTLAEGNYEIAIAPAGTSLEEAVIGPAVFNLVEDTWITVAAVGSAEAGTLATNVLIEDYTALPDEDFARVSITHAIYGAPPISINTSDDFPLVSSLAYPGTRGNNDGFYVRPADVGIFDLDMVLTNTGEAPIATATDIEFEAGMNYLIAAIGTADEPTLLIIGSSMDGDAMMMASGESMIEAPTDEPIEAVVEVDPTEVEPTEAPTTVPTEVEPTLVPTLVPTLEPTLVPTIEPTLVPTLEPTLVPTIAPTETLSVEVTEELVVETTEEASDAPVIIEEPVETTEEPTEEPMLESTEEVMDDMEATEEPMVESTEEAMDDTEATEDPMVESTEEAMSEVSNTIADIVLMIESEEAEFSVLLATIMAADESILAMLSDPDAELTVFAPTDEAFVTLLEILSTDVDSFLTDTETLNMILPYHVLDGVMMAETILTLDSESVPTMLGEDATISITVTDGGVILNDSIQVTTVNIEAINGVIHIIDGVLVPETETE